MSNEGEDKGLVRPQNKKIDEQSTDGLNAWNDRLDENLETDDQNNPLADKKSKDFFEKNENLTEE